MAYIYFSEQEKEAANATDIATYLTTHGEAVKRVGREKVWHSPSGKVSLNGSVWYSQYEQTGGGAINFVRKYFGKSFPEAVRDLLGQNVGTDVVPREKTAYAEDKTEFAAPEKHTDMRRVYGYLLNERCLDRDVIHAFAHAGLIYEEPEYHNAVFLGMDENGTPRHAQKRSTVPASDFKNNVAGSNADYSFHWNGTSDHLYVFEAPIDLLAYISMHQNGWQEHSYHNKIEEVPPSEEKKYLPSFERYRGYDERVYGSEIITILKGAREYSGYDITPIIKQMKDEIEFLKRKYPDRYSDENFRFDFKERFSQIYDWERKRGR